MFGCRRYSWALAVSYIILILILIHTDRRYSSAMSILCLVEVDFFKIIYMTLLQLKVE